MDWTGSGRLYRESGAERWSVPPVVFGEALQRSAAKAFAGRRPSESDLDRYFRTLHLGDLALACACADGHEPAWDHFITEFRPVLYRAADAIAPGGGARDVAEGLYAELFGIKERDGERQSLFRYFHGRSSLSTWLRSLMTQRYVDRLREARRLEPLPDEASPAALPARGPDPNPDRARFVAAMRAVLAAAIASLEPRDRLRLGCYYAEEMTLAQIGKLTREHEATVSRQLARARRAIREDVERRLRIEHGFSEPEVAECFAGVVNDAGTLDLGVLLNPARKESGGDRSTQEDQR